MKQFQSTNLLCSIDPPLVSISSQPSLMVKVGAQLSLYCTAQGLPNPTVQWYKGSQPVILKANALLQLLNVPTQSPHTTVYTCIGRNRIGTTPANVTVIVEGTHAELCHFSIVHILYK